jgi:hypothetical protein
MSTEQRPILMLDTSSINGLTDDPDSGALIAGLRSGYFVRFPFTSISEIIATTSGDRRQQLLQVCRRLLASAGDCIEPHHEIIRIMVARFEKSLPLDLEYVNLRMGIVEDEILRVQNFDDSLATQEREEGRANNKVFVGVYADAKSAFDGLVANGIEMPRNVAELVSQLQQGGAFWTLARNLFERVATKPADDPAIKKFYAQCAPFRTLMIALCAAQYDRCIRPVNASPSLKTGRNDTFMATGLPYCDQFITNDAGQLACYTEVIPLAGLSVTVRSYEDFRNGLLVFGAAAGSARGIGVR